MGTIWGGGSRGTWSRPPLDLLWQICLTWRHSAENGPVPILVDRWDVPRDGDVRVLRDDGLQVPARGGQPLLHAQPARGRPAWSVSAPLNIISGNGLFFLSCGYLSIHCGASVLALENGKCKCICYPVFRVHEWNKATLLLVLRILRVFVIFGLHWEATWWPELVWYQRPNRRRYIHKYIHSR